MTVAFEFLAGHYVFGYPWPRLCVGRLIAIQQSNQREGDEERDHGTQSEREDSFFAGYEDGATACGLPRT